MTEQHEEWKAIPGFEGYEASSLGRIRSIDRTLSDGRKLKGQILAYQVNVKNKRRYVSLGRAAKRPVAVFVAMAFLGHIPQRLDRVVDHRNEDRTDDRLENLTITTNRKNIAKGYAAKGKLSGLPTGVSRTKRNKKPYMATCYINGKTVFLGTFYTIEEASDAYKRAAAGAEANEQS